jgi:hypothetical protein
VLQSVMELELLLVMEWGESCRWFWSREWNLCWCWRVASGFGAVAGIGAAVFVGAEVRFGAWAIELVFKRTCWSWLQYWWRWGFVMVPLPERGLELVFELECGYRWSCCWSGAVGFGTSCRRGEGRMLLLLLE